MRFLVWDVQFRLESIVVLLVRQLLDPPLHPRRLQTNAWHRQLVHQYPDEVDVGASHLGHQPLGVESSQVDLAILQEHQERGRVPMKQGSHQCQDLHLELL